jgi:Transposase
LLVVVDHDSGRLVWAGKGADQVSLVRFFTRLGPTRCAQITHVSSDSAQWMDDVIAAHCPQAVRCADPYHVVTWAMEALDVQRRTAWNAARGAARGHSRGRRPRGQTKGLKDARCEVPALFRRSCSGVILVVLVDPSSKLEACGSGFAAAVCRLGGSRAVCGAVPHTSRVFRSLSRRPAAALDL